MGISKEELLLKRKMRRNRPERDPGMEDENPFGGLSFNKTQDEYDSNPLCGGSKNPFGDSDPFGGSSNPFGGSSSSFGRSSFGNNSFGDQFNNESNGGFTSNFGDNSYSSFQPQQPQQPMTDDEKFFQVAGHVAKGSFNFLKEAITTFGTLTATNKKDIARNSIITSVVLAVIGLILGLIGMKSGYRIMVGSIMTIGISVILFMIYLPKASQEEVYVAEEDYPEDENYDEESNPFDFTGEDFDNNFDNNFGSENIPENSMENMEDLVSGEYDEDSDYTQHQTKDDYANEVIAKMFGEDNPLEIQDFDVPDAKVGEIKDLEEVETNAMKIGKFYNKEILLKDLLPYFENVNPDFKSVFTLPENTEEFLDYEQILNEIMPYIGIDIRERLEIQEVQKNIYFTKIIMNRPIKVSSNAVLEKIRQEFHNVIESDLTQKEKESFTSFIQQKGATIELTLYGLVNLPNRKQMVSIKDAIKESKKQIDKYDIPILLGATDEGGIVATDMKKEESMVVLGQPGSGKTWTLLSVMTQLCMYLSPKQLNIYVFDPKENGSDYYSVDMPQIRDLSASKDDLNKRLDWAINVEAPRRAAILAEARNQGKECKDIWEYWKKFPEKDDMPLIYIWIEEVITFVNEMSKEEKQEFEGNLLAAITRLRSVGIRVMMVLHKANNNIIKKTITDMIPVKLALREKPDNMSSLFGVPVKALEKPAIKVGDAYVKLTEGYPTFMHALTLGSDDDNIRHSYEAVKEYWLKQEPESKKGSKLEKKEKGLLFTDDYDKIIEEDTERIEKNQAKEEVKYQSEEEKLKQDLVDELELNLWD